MIKQLKNTLKDYVHLFVKAISIKEIKQKKIMLI